MGIGAMLGPVAVVLWSSLRTLTNLVTRVFDLVNQAFYPEVSMAWGAGDKALVRRLHRVSCQASLWLGLSAVVFLAVLGPWIFAKWTQGKVALDLPLFWGFLGLVALRSLWYTSYVVPSAINRHQRLTVMYLIASALGLGVSVGLLWGGLDLVWALAGFAAVELVMVAIVVPQSLQLSEDRAGGFLSAALPPPNPLAVMRVALGRRSDL